MTIEHMQQALEALGFTIGDRDPRINTDFVGQFMVVEAYEQSELPTRDGRNGPWCIVGNDLGALITKAYELWIEDDPNGN